MPEHQDWIIILLGDAWERLNLIAGKSLGRSYLSNDPISLRHVVGVLIAFFIVLVLAIRAKSALDAAKQNQESRGGLLPDRTLTARNFFELLSEAILGQLEKQMGKERARRFFPLIATYALFIFFCNVLGLIPGLLPPTDTLSTTVPLALTSFLTYNYFGMQAQGVGKYIKHFCGPLLPDISKPKTYPAILMVLLMFPLEIVSNLARVLSLSVRLMVNLFADHTMLGIFYSIFALLVPLPIMLLGVLVCVLQAFIFMLLSGVYISVATEIHDHGDDHGHDKHGHDDHKQTSHATAEAHSSHL
jgi:F-type H+-transporting ATPase subunit a